MTLLAFLQQTSQAVDYTVGIVVPGLVFVVSFLAAWLLYRHFSGQAASQPDPEQEHTDTHRRKP